MSDLITAVQCEVFRIQEMITETKQLIPNGNASFVIYESLLNQAREAIVTHDTVLLVKLLPELKAA